MSEHVVRVDIVSRRVFVNDEPVGSMRRVGMGSRGTGWRVEVCMWPRQWTFECMTSEEVHAKMHDLLNPPGVHTKKGRRLVADEVDGIALDIRRVFAAQGEDASYVYAELHDIACRLRV